MRPIHFLKRLGFVACFICLLGSPWAANVIENGEFNEGYYPWEAPGWWAGGGGISEVDAKGRFCVTITQLGTANWGAQLRQSGITYVAGETYDVSLTVWSSAAVNIEMSAVDEDNGFVWIFGDILSFNAPLDGDGQSLRFSFPAGASSDVGKFRFLLGNGAVPLNETVCFDDIVVDGPDVNMLTNTTFDGPLAPPAEANFWGTATGGGDVDVANERFCMDIANSGDNEWEANFRERTLSFVNGRNYDFSADFWTTSDINIQISAADESEGFTWIFGRDFPITATPLDGPATPISATFIAEANSEGTGDFRFLFGGDRVPDGTTICFDNLKLLDPQGSSEPELPPPSLARVNQLGYLPFADKRATYALPEGAEDIEAARPWELKQGETIVASGLTIPRGGAIDAASGDIVHTIDFSDVTTEGTDYTITVTEGEETYTSEIFPISFGLFTQLKYDALAYFYHNRSGTPILAEVVGDALARPAGHESDMSLETTACIDGDEGCTTLDVSGGWYDAGDHGKYVVNGGISIWTLLNQYERSKYQGDNLEDFGDGTMSLPTTETTNGVSDLLDEVRWEMDWFLKMQVPANQPHHGMVYHKLHDESWTGLPTAPHEDPKTRYVHPPTTAATLNFAAVAAQSYRVYKNIDRRFAFECLARGIYAYLAAKTNPILLAATSADDGGGAYADSNLEDEFYWAATELYISTGFPFFARDMRRSPLHLTVPDQGVSMMSWGITNGLGMISLATVGERFHLNKIWIARAKQAIVRAADKYVASTINEGYALPLSADQYPWGSNSDVANNLIVLGLANDFTCGDDKYASAMLEGVDYLFGRNPMGHSYVTGYGSRVEQNPHHRFWANSLNPAYPVPPPGVLSGGPNSGIEDPVAQALLRGCAPQRCFVDNINAWSVNEVTINWNAPFAWVMAYLDELAYSENEGVNQCRERGRHYRHRKSHKSRRR